ncbi:MAG: FkbM family methyltransferase [Porticoccaceae bacterium]|nr:FkbM family methyltransferase [Porticoccaceae bacterium]
MGSKLRSRIASWFGYDLVKQKKQMTLESHLRSLLPLLKVDLVLDVGGNEGQYGRLLRSMGYQGEIVSFEPLPKAFDVLSRRCRSDESWSCFSYALGEEYHETYFNIARNSVFSSFHLPNDRGTSQYWPRIEVVDKIPVRVLRLDDVLPEVVPDYAGRRILLKMDTQGHDSWVVRGAERSMSSILALHSELSVAGIYEGVPDYVQMLSNYRDLGFELTGIYPSGHDINTGHVVELDCVMARESVPGMAAG